MKRLTWSARSRSDFVATNSVGMWSRLYCCCGQKHNQGENALHGRDHLPEDCWYTRTSWYHWNHAHTRLRRRCLFSLNSVTFRPRILTQTLATESIACQTNQSWEIRNQSYHKILLRSRNIHRINDADHFACRFICPSEGFTDKRSQKRSFPRSCGTTHVAQKDIPCHFAFSTISLTRSGNIKRIRPWFVGVSQVCQEGECSFVIEKGSHTVRGISVGIGWMRTFYRPPLGEPTLKCHSTRIVCKSGVGKLLRRPRIARRRAK